LTDQIAAAVFDTIKAQGAGVVIEARHLSLMMRGVGKQNSQIQSSTLRGCFFQPAVRRDFFAHVIKSVAM